MNDLLRRRNARFTLWLPAPGPTPPRLIIGRFKAGNPPALTQIRKHEMTPAGPDHLWEADPAAIGLANGAVYHYWFEVDDGDVYRPAEQRRRLWVTDPLATCVDWRLVAPAPSPDYGEEALGPAAVIKYDPGRGLVACDPGGEENMPPAANRLADLPPNSRLVIYELPTAWARRHFRSAALGVGTFRDVLALLDPSSGGGNFAPAAGSGHLAALGVNAIELLPPADSFQAREWGYGTSNYAAPDFDLGFPTGNASPTPNGDLTALIAACHRRGIRFIADQVMGFATCGALRHLDFLAFHVDYHDQGDPERHYQGGAREPFGGDLFRYAGTRRTYDPVSGQVRELVPARQFMLTVLARWQRDFRIDGVRIDSLPTIGNWDFVSEFTAAARANWHAGWAVAAAAAGGTAAPVASPAERDARFLVVGEDLAVPREWLRQRRLDGLWNEEFKHRVRSALLGRHHDGDGDFASTITRLIDCRLTGFADLSQAVIYLGSHDVGGFANERLYDYLRANGVADPLPRIALAFAVLLTAAGTPMILAGDEFGDQHDLPASDSLKQVDAVNFARAREPARQALFAQVARLVRLRTTCDALAVNDGAVIHADVTAGRRVVAWRRGVPGAASQVVVVANFSDWGSDDPTAPHSEYVVPDWPATPPGRSWREVTANRVVPAEWVGREPLYPWQAKVYCTV